MPDTLGRYQLLDKLGEGGMATVYRAHDPGIHRTVAIKVLHAALSENPEYRQRFLREAKAAGKLSHPNIVTIYDVAEQDGRPYIAMELLQGSSLAQLMESGTQLPLAQILRIGVQLADALDYAHSRGIVHRDITPSNIICLQDTETIKITDFGIAHMDGAELSERTKVGTVLGTAYYMSPEQMEAVAEIDGRSDLFSVGVILYQLVTGQRPFAGDSLMALYKGIIKSEFKPPEKLAPGTPPALKKIIARLLNKERDQRFQSGHEVADALRQVLEDIQDQEHTPQRMIPLRIRWTLLMGGIVALLLIPGLMLTYRAQYTAMSRLAFELGSALAQMIAADNAEGMLLEDWIGIQTLVEQTAGEQALSYLVITDHRGIVRGSTQPGGTGIPYASADLGQPLATVKDTVIYERRLADGSRVFHFNTPIRFQQAEIGRVHLGLSQAPLRDIARQALGMALLLIAVTVVTVIVVGYFLSARLSHPIRVLRRSLNALAEGRYEQRIEEQRKDEFGLLYAAFNRAAEALRPGSQKPPPKLPLREVPVPPAEVHTRLQPVFGGAPPPPAPPAPGSDETRPLQRSQAHASPKPQPPVDESDATCALDQEKITSAIRHPPLRRPERFEPPEES